MKRSFAFPGSYSGSRSCALKNFGEDENEYENEYDELFATLNPSKAK